MRRLTALVLLAFASMQAAGSAQPTTVTGIPLDSAWKTALYSLARSTFKHPAWGWQHSERNYRVALELASADHLAIDTDVLFAASFLHDMAAFRPCADAKMEHGDCAALESGAVLRKAGFPMSKLAAVQAAERAHMYYRDPGTRPEAIVLHDADSLDFLGAIAQARMIALTGEQASSFAPAIQQLRGFIKDIPPHLVTRAAKRIGGQRAAELQAFIDRIDAETFDGRAM